MPLISVTPTCLRRHRQHHQHCLIHQPHTVSIIIDFFNSSRPSDNNGNQPTDQHHPPNQPHNSTNPKNARPPPRRNRKPRPPPNPSPPLPLPQRDRLRPLPVQTPAPPSRYHIRANKRSPRRRHRLPRHQKRHNRQQM